MGKKEEERRRREMAEAAGQGQGQEQGEAQRDAGHAASEGFVARHQHPQMYRLKISRRQQELWDEQIKGEGSEDELDTDDDEGGNCLVCHRRKRLLLCFGQRGADATTGKAEAAHTVCKKCLNRWFSAHNELRAATGLGPRSRH
eukprot:CAMPEP_0174749636 /NCGR_PEP_ID=MMETSP1094-20130205/96088_1 /TAXON_ID=156173 /ORGANISM="Chrysochromulina brevifilum, Strain UTEX LB 985" /LENGTH=143 /DNA_ID=CAMNT_0015954871 /DNA_START=6 /DNA_END=434 /DNA_ORIENTATION=-